MGNENGSDHDDQSARLAHEVIKVARFGIVHPKPLRQGKKNILQFPVTIAAPPENQQSQPQEQKAGRTGRTVILLCKF